MTAGCLVSLCDCKHVDGAQGTCSALVGQWEPPSQGLLWAQAQRGLGLCHQTGGLAVGAVQIHWWILIPACSADLVSITPLHPLGSQWELQQSSWRYPEPQGTFMNIFAIKFRKFPHLPSLDP